MNMDMNMNMNMNLDFPLFCFSSLGYVFISDEGGQKVGVSMLVLKCLVLSCIGIIPFGGLPNIW